MEYNYKIAIISFREVESYEIQYMYILAVTHDSCWGSNFVVSRCLSVNHKEKESFSILQKSFSLLEIIDKSVSLSCLDCGCVRVCNLLNSWIPGSPTHKTLTYLRFPLFWICYFCIFVSFFYICSTLLVCVESMFLFSRNFSSFYKCVTAF